MSQFLIHQSINQFKRKRTKFKMIENLRFMSKFKTVINSNLFLQMINFKKKITSLAFPKVMMKILLMRTSFPTMMTNMTKSFFSQTILKTKI
jgi:hypothetical protein